MASPCVRPRGLKKGANGQIILPQGYKFRKKPGKRKKGGLPCIVKAKGKKAKSKKTSAKKSSSRRRKTSAGVARAYHSGAQAYAAARGCPRGSYRDKRSGKCRKLVGAAAAAAAGKKVGFMRRRGSSARPDFMAF